MKRIGLGLCLVALGLAPELGCGDDARPQAQATAGSGNDSSNTDSAAGTGGNPAGGAPAPDTAGQDAGGSAASPVGGQGGATPSGVAGAAAGAPPLGGAGDTPDPCQGVSAQGECATPTQARTCVVPTGNGSPMLVTADCRAFEHCQSSSGQARCVVNANACLPGQAACVSTHQLRTCDAKGVAHTQTCPGDCQSSAVGAFCATAAATGTFQGTLEYEAVPVYDDYSDWADTSVYAPAEGVLVLSGDGTNWLDAALVDKDGAFSLKVPTSHTGLEQLAFFTLHPDPTGAVVQFGVYNPNVKAGVVSTDKPVTGAPWSWSMPLSAVTSGAHIQIHENEGSGAIHIYTRLLQIQRIDTDFYKSPPGSIVAWMHLNTEWDCGACFAPWNIDVDGTPFDSQLFISATAQDRAYWSDAVTVHESGHYTMWSYGLSPNEGGVHCLGQPTAPGQAWSEGWATGFSSIMRASPVYYDKQQGSMFWFDLGLRKYDDQAWVRPKPGAGLLQDIDENEVAAMLWSLANDASVGADVTLAALQTTNVTVPSFNAVQLHLELPEGARLVSGNESELLPTGNGKLTRHFMVHLDKVPATDLEVFATTSSNSFGARAKSAYRFGRPEPRFAEPVRAASPLVVSGKNVGTPIQLKPTKRKATERLEILFTEDRKIGRSEWGATPARLPRRAARIRKAARLRTLRCGVVPIVDTSESATRNPWQRGAQSGLPLAFRSSDLL